MPPIRNLGDARIPPFWRSMEKSLKESLGAAMYPKRILLATDLSSRGDRALDRALQLAREWQSTLHIVHAVKAYIPSVPAGVNAAE